MSHAFILQRRLMYTDCVTELYRNGICPRICRTPAHFKRPPLDTTRLQKHDMTAKRPIEEEAYYPHLYTCRATPLFEVSKIDRP